MHVMILGAGISGVLSAYYLGRAGHKVTVLDRQSEAAQECSYSNGGQLSYSHCEPWANPNVFPKLFKWARQDDAPLVFRFSKDPEMIKWGVRFLQNCAPWRSDRHAQTLLRVGMHSKAKMKEIRNDTGLNFHWNDKGILHVFDSQKGLDEASAQAKKQAEWGCAEEILSWEDCLKKEPSLAHTTKKIYGGVFAPLDETGDIHIFTQKLAQHIETRFDVEFKYGTEINGLEQSGNEITGVQTNDGLMSADGYVVCLGAHAPLLLRKVGVKVPIYPMKGYSITLPADEFSPISSVTDDALKIVYTRLGDVVRVAGTAEFAGYDASVSKVRTDAIKRGIQTLYPKADLSQPKEWACLRPSTPDGPPIVGRTKLKNLYLNTGHGTLGWTQGASTASLLASIIDGETPEITLDGLSARRY